MSKTKKFTLTAEADDKQITVTGENDGFNVMELIGILDHKIRDLYEELRYPERFKRFYTDKDGNRVELVKESEGADDETNS